MLQWAHRSTAYTALAIGKQIDAAIMYQPLTQLCQFNKTCETVIDMTIGEGPKSLEATSGANIVFAARKEMVESNPKLMEAFYAAMTDAAAWFNDPKNFDELVKIYTPIISFGDMAGADEMRRNWIKSVIPALQTESSLNPRLQQGPEGQGLGAAGAHGLQPREQDHRREGRGQAGAVGQGATDALI